jgi:hypothetical protein
MYVRARNALERFGGGGGFRKKIKGILDGRERGRHRCSQRSGL